MPQIFEVGGKVRDDLLGLENKDHDFTFVLTPGEAEGKNILQSFEFMQKWMLEAGYQIFLITADCLTIRAKFPPPQHTLVADFVLARKELKYFAGTRKPEVIPGSLLDDLKRRDFTVNAIARSETGEIIDPLGGQADMAAKLLRTPLPAMVTLTDDPLRALRAIRFSVKLGFRLAQELEEALHNPVLPELMSIVSDDRVREELTKAFKANSWQTLKLLHSLPEALTASWLQRSGMWLLPTTRQ